MIISDNILSAFFAGTSTVEEDKQIIDSMVTDEEFSDIFDIINELDSMDEIKELRNEFNENLDISDKFSDYKINIK